MVGAQQQVPQGVSIHQDQGGKQGVQGQEGKGVGPPAGDHDPSGTAARAATPAASQARTSTTSAERARQRGLASGAGGASVTGAEGPTAAGAVPGGAGLGVGGAPATAAGGVPAGPGSDTGGSAIGPPRWRVRESGRTTGTAPRADSGPKHEHRLPCRY